MPQSTFSTSDPYTTNALWKTPVRALHWLAAASLAGAAFLTSQGDSGHAALGWIALGALSIRLFGSGEARAHGPALWLVTAAVVVLDLSGLLAPHGTIHAGASLAALVLAALYCATVLFESVQCITARTASGPGTLRRHKVK